MQRKVVVPMVIWARVSHIPSQPMHNCKLRRKTEQGEGGVCLEGGDLPGNMSSTPPNLQEQHSWAQLARGDKSSTTQCASQQAKGDQKDPLRSQLLLEYSRYAIGICSLRCRKK